MSRIDSIQARPALMGLVVLFLGLGLPAQAPVPAGEHSVPAWAYQRVTRGPAELLRRPDEGLTFRQLLQVERREFQVLEGTEEPADTTTLEITLTARYGLPGEALVPWDLGLEGLRLTRVHQERQVVIDSAEIEQLPEDLQEALAVFQTSSVRAGVDRGGRLVGVAGSEELLCRILAPLQAPGLRATIGRFLQGSLAAGTIEGTLYRLHPPVPAGRLRPDQTFYRSFRIEVEPVGGFEVLLQHVFLGTGAVGDRRVAVFWSRLVFPALEGTRIRAGGQEFTLEQPRSVASGVVRVDLESGHALTADIELVQEQSVAVGGSIVRKRSRQEFRLRTFAPAPE